MKEFNVNGEVGAVDAINSNTDAKQALTTTHTTNEIDRALANIPNHSSIKSIQKGSVNLSGIGVTTNESISAVDTAKSVVLCSSAGDGVTGKLIGSTTLQFGTYRTGGSICEWQVIEYV